MIDFPDATPRAAGILIIQKKRQKSRFFTWNFSFKKLSSSTISKIHSCRSALALGVQFATFSVVTVSRVSSHKLLKSAPWSCELVGC